ncbi:MAG: TSUP family transporter, partial [Thermoproteota archaeon]|nr:TSUP family transporter [Thermoproteota archaeon]
MVGLILGVLRFPFIIGAETSIGVAAGTNIGISTMAAIPAAVRHFRQNNVNTRIFLVMAITGAVGAFFGSFLTRYVPVALLLSLI